MNPAELLGRSCFEFLHPDEREQGKEGFRRRKDLGDHSSREYRFVRKDGSTIWLSLVGSPMYDEAGATTGIVAMCTDTTERRNTEERIRQLNRELGSRLAELETLLRVSARRHWFFPRRGMSRDRPQPGSFSAVRYVR